MPIIASFGCQIYSNCLSRCNWILRVQPDWPIYASLIILYIHMDFQTYRRFFIFCTELQIAILNICPSHTYIYIYINESCFVKWPIKIDKYVFFDCIVTERAKTIRQIRNSWPFYWLQLMGEDGDGRIVIHVCFVNWKPLNVSILLIAYTIFFFVCLVRVYIFTINQIHRLTNVYNSLHIYSVYIQLEEKYYNPF